MKKNLLPVVFFIILFFGYVQTTTATHVRGALMQYEYVGKGATPGTQRYKLIGTLQLDCAGIAFLNTSISAIASCSPSNTPSYTVNLNKVKYRYLQGERVLANGGRDVTQICTGVKTRCEGRTNHGIYEYQFEGFVDLPPCSNWQFYFTSACCRPSTGNGSGAAFTPYTTLNNLNNQQNNSPTVNKKLFNDVYTLIGQTTNYSLAVNDPDGDSLVYLFANPTVTLGGNTINTFTYRSPYTYQKPITGITLDSCTGILSFKSLLAGSSRIGFEVLEYDRCSKRLKGKTLHDITFHISAGNNSLPFETGGISSVSNATKTSKYELELCENAAATWSDTIKDINASDSLHIYSNIADVLPGAKYSIKYLKRNEAIVTYSWTGQRHKHNQHNYFVLFSDNVCPKPGIGIVVYKVKLNEGLNLGNDITICKGDTAFLKPINPMKLTWKVVSGDTIKPNINWIVDTIPNGLLKMKFLPTKTTVLAVKTDTLFNSCGLKSKSRCNLNDTIKINVADSFSLAPINPPTTCYGSDNSISVKTSKMLNYTYKWNNGQWLNADTIQSPKFLNLTKPTHFKVTVTSAAGCIRTASVFADVTEAWPDSFFIEASDTLLCFTDTVNLNLKPVLKAKNCDLISLNKLVGNYKIFTGKPVNHTSGFNPVVKPSPYSTGLSGQRLQMIYSAKYLNSLGINQGPITSIGFNVVRIAGISPGVVKNYKIKMGCDTINTFPVPTFAHFIPNLKEVYAGVSDTLNTGWNTHNFANAYNWDGSSNLIIEIIWDSGSTLLNNIEIALDSVNYIASASYNRVNISNPAPSSVNQPTYVFNYLPQIQLGVSEGYRKRLLNTNWAVSPNGSILGSTNNQSIKAQSNLPGVKTYTVTVSDSATGICKDTIRKKVNVVLKYDATPKGAGPYCIHDGTIVMQSNTPHNICSPGGKWSGIGIIDTLNGHWNPKMSGTGKHWVKYSVTGNACSAEDSLQITIKGSPNSSFIGPDSICSYNTFDTLGNKLMPAIIGGQFSGKGIDSVANSRGGFTYFINPKYANPSTINSDTLFIKYQVNDYCISDTTIGFKVVAPWDSTFLGTIYNGQTIYTDSFCASSNVPEKLKVAGLNASWKCLTEPNAIADSITGEFIPSIAFGSSKNTKVKIEVSTTGFCASKNTFDLKLIETPEIEVVTERYCDWGINDTANFNKIDSVWLRIPKGPALAGSTGKRRLNANGFDTNTEVMVHYASKKLTGWNESVDGISGQYAHNSWDGKPWMPIPNVARYRIKSLPKGKQRIIYKYSIYYRNNHPNNICSISDTAYVIYDSIIPITNLADTYDLCKSAPAYLEPDSVKGMTYSWNSGQKTAKIVATTDGTYTVSAKSKYCLNTKTVQVITCVGLSENATFDQSLTVFPNPARDEINIKISDNRLSQEFVIELIDLTGKRVFTKALVFKDPNYSINASTFQSGTYFLKLTSNNQTSTYRIVIH